MTQQHKHKNKQTKKKKNRRTLRRDTRLEIYGNIRPNEE